MGIDVYARWDGQTEAERQAQYTGFSIMHGHVGYLREAYHGDPYATKVLFPECFENEDDVAIPAAKLRERLPDAINATRARYADSDGKFIAEVIASVVSFVELYERLESEGKNPRVYVSY
jgi:hypothetical protein